MVSEHVQRSEVFLLHPHQRRLKHVTLMDEGKPAENMTGGGGHYRDVIGCARSWGVTGRGRFLQEQSLNEGRSLS